MTALEGVRGTVLDAGCGLGTYAERLRRVIVYGGLLLASTNGRPDKREIGRSGPRPSPT